MNDRNKKVARISVKDGIDNTPEVFISMLGKEPWEGDAELRM